MTTNNVCTYCGQEHPILNDVICPFGINFNKENLPIEEPVFKKYFSFDIEFKKQYFEKLKPRNLEKLLKYIKECQEEHFRTDGKTKKSKLNDNHNTSFS